MSRVAGTLFGRWYVTAFGVTFAVLAVRHLGWRRTVVYALAAVGVGLVAENGSASSLGFPYGRYSFDEGLRSRELWVGNVPLMVSLSYTFMSYFAFATARLVVAGPHRTRAGGRRLAEWLVGVTLAVWMIWIVDPVSRLGEHFFLGHLFDYAGPGFWFGLPLSSQLGFTLTSGVLVGMLVVLADDEPDQAVESVWRHPRLPAAGAYLGQVAFMAVTAGWVALRTDDPAVASTAATLAGAAVLLYLPIIVVLGVTWRGAGSRP